jgi:branched-chain amino acid transport system substrate-binding protein
VKRLLAAALLAGAVGGCGTTQTGSSSTVTATGRTLSIWLSVPSGASAAEQDVLAAERLAFAVHEREVTRFSLRLRGVAGAELSDNARAAIQDPSAIAYLGELAPGGSDGTVGITNALDLLQVSPTDTALELTQATPAVSGAPARYYEQLGSYGHTFARMAPNTAHEARAQVGEMQRLGVSSLYVTDDGSDYGRALAAAVRHAATGASLKLAGSVAAAAAMFYAGSPAAAAPALRHAAQARAGLKLFGSSSLADPGLTSQLAGVGTLYVSVPAPGADAQGGFLHAFVSAYHHRPAPEAAFGYAAMSAVLSTLQEAGAAANDRGTVVRDFHRIRNRSSVIGTYSIDAAGDTSLADFGFERLSHGAFVPVRGAPLPG